MTGQAHHPRSGINHQHVLKLFTSIIEHIDVVEDNEKGPRLANARPSEKVGIAAKVEVHAPPVEQNQ